MKKKQETIEELFAWFEQNGLGIRAERYRGGGAAAFVCRNDEFRFSGMTTIAGRSLRMALRKARTCARRKLIRKDKP